MGATIIIRALPALAALFSLLAHCALQLTSAQTSSQPPAANDYSTEAFVAEDSSTRVLFEGDGTYRRESGARIRIQSAAGVQRYSVLTLAYEDAVESLQIEYVRVRKPDGNVVATPSDNVQDMPSEITREAPFYSDLREKHVAVKGLAVGDVLEFKSSWNATKPLVPGQFWYAYNFTHDIIILHEQLEIGVPRNRPVKWKSPDLKPVITDENTRRMFTWTSSQLEHVSADQERKEKEQTLYQSARGKNPPPDVQLSSFQSWEEVGRWYAALQQDRNKATPEIQAKATEITKGLTDQEAKIHAIYAFVSTQFRYIGVAFGIGRYQPHLATEVLANQYGDCKDKHTLLASLLGAIGVKAYPALIASTHDIDPDVPSPGQFDHVISTVSAGDHLTWLDTTPELAPFGYLIGPLRDKPALLIPEGKPAALTTTPVNPLHQVLQTFRIEAKLSETGTLTGKVERNFQGDDSELLLRLAFRNTPMPQWKDLIQQISASAGFGGEVSETTVSSPEKTNEPFRITYAYTRKDYSDWSNRRITPPLPIVGLPSLDDKDGKPYYPVWLGPAAQIHFQSDLELPKGYTPNIPIGLDLKEDFAEYHVSHHLKHGVLHSERQLIVKLHEVPTSEYEAYRKFSKAVFDDYGTYIALVPANAPVLSYQNAIWSLPESTNADATAAFRRAAEEFQKQDLQSGIASLKRAVELDPQFTRAWLTLGELYKNTGKSEEAVQSYRRALKVNPKEPMLYKALASTLVGRQKFEDAIAVWQECVKVDPNNSDAYAGLGSSLYRLKRYKESAAAFQSALDLTPEVPGLHVQLGSAYLRAGDEDKAMRAYRDALALDNSPRMLNNVSYALADANKDLPRALEYAEKAVLLEEQNSQDAEPSDLQMEDLAHANNLAAYWDTLGWAHFRMRNFEQAEKYLTSAWRLSQSGSIAEHLAEVYEQENKKQSAIHMYKVSLYCYNSMGPRDDAAVVTTEERLEKLTPGHSNSERYNFTAISEDVNLTRTVKLARSWADEATAQFFIILARDQETGATKVQGVKFVTGSEELKSADKALTPLTFHFTFPDDGPTRLVRRGILACFKNMGCSFTLIRPSDVHSLH